MAGGPPGSVRCHMEGSGTTNYEAAPRQRPGAEVGHAFRSVCSPGLADGPGRHRARPALGCHGRAGRARRAGRRLGVDLGLRPLPHGARAVAGGDARGVDADGRPRRGDQPGPPGADVHLHELPQPGLPGQGRRDDRHHLRGPRRDGHRRRVVRARVAGLRVRLPVRGGADRPARRGCPDLPGPVDHGHREPAGQALPGRRGHLPAAPAAGHDRARFGDQRHPDVDRRWRREEDPADRRGVRRLHQLRRRARGVQAQERGAAGPLCRRRPRLRRRSCGRPTTTW